MTAAHYMNGAADETSFPTCSNEATVAVYTWYYSQTTRILHATSAFIVTVPGPPTLNFVSLSPDACMTLPTLRSLLLAGT